MPSAWADGVDINDVKFERNKMLNGQKGMNIFVDVSLEGYQGERLRADVFFYLEDGGQVDATRQNRYRSATGGAMVQESFTVPTMKERSEVALFMPYSEFNLPEGKLRMKAMAVIYWHSPPEELARSQTIPFVFTR